MTATINIVFDDQAVVDGLARLEGLGGSAQMLMTVLGSALVDTTRTRFTTNIGPDGQKWQPLNPAYDAFRRPGPMLVQSSALRGSLTFLSSAHDVQIGSPMIYARVQQFGATIRPRNARALVFRMGAGGTLVMARAVTIPARPYLGISFDDERMIFAETEEYIGRLWRG